MPSKRSKQSATDQKEESDNFQVLACMAYVAEIAPDNVLLQKANSKVRVNIVAERQSLDHLVGAYGLTGMSVLSKGDIVLVVADRQKLPDGSSQWSVRFGSTKIYRSVRKTAYMPNTTMLYTPIDAYKMPVSSNALFLKEQLPRFMRHLDGMYVESANNKFSRGRGN